MLTDTTRQDKKSLMQTHVVKNSSAIYAQKYLRTNSVSMYILVLLMQTINTKFDTNVIIVRKVLQQSINLKRTC